MKKTKRIVISLVVLLLVMSAIHTLRVPLANKRGFNFNDALAAWQSINLGDTKALVAAKMVLPYRLRTQPIQEGEAQMIDKSREFNVAAVKSYYLYYFKQSVFDEYLLIIGFDENGQAIAKGMLDSDALHDHHEYLK
jgi:hypothetical protein